MNLQRVLVPTISVICSRRADSIEELEHAAGCIAGYRKASMHSDGCMGVLVVVMFWRMSGAAFANVIFRLYPLSFRFPCQSTPLARPHTTLRFMTPNTYR